MAGKAICAALQAVQRDLKVPKNQYNSFGDFKYRSCEDIVEAVKPLLNAHGLILIMADEVIGVADRVYIKATCKVIDVATGDSVETTALAREALTKKGMDESQITGTASSYARKYALNGLFAIDDTKDADTDAYRQQGNAGQQKAPAQRQPTIQQQTAELLRNFSAEANKAGIDNGLIGQVVKYKYGKTGKELTMAEASEFVNNFAKFRDEMLKEGAA